MRNAKVEKYNAACGQFDRDGFFLWNGAADMVVAVGVAVVREFFPMTAWYNVQSAVLDGGIVKCDPHAHAFGGVTYFEVGIVLVPVGTHALFAGFEKDLVQVEDKGIANELFNRCHDFGVEVQRAIKRAFGRDGADLEVDLSCGVGLSIPIGCYIAQQAVVFESVEFSAHSFNFTVYEHVANNSVTLISE